MTYLESTTANPIPHSPFLPVPMPEVDPSVAWERVQARVKAFIGPEKFEPLMKLKFERLRGATAVLIVPTNGLKLLAGFQHDLILKAWHAELETVQDVDIIVREVGTGRKSPLPCAPKIKTVEPVYNSEAKFRENIARNEASRATRPAVQAPVIQDDVPAPPTEGERQRQFEELAWKNVQARYDATVSYIGITDGSCRVLKLVKIEDGGCASFNLPASDVIASFKIMPRFLMEAWQKEQPDITVIRVELQPSTDNLWCRPWSPGLCICITPDTAVDATFELLFDAAQNELLDALRRGSGEGHIRIEYIQRIVARAYDVSRQEMVSYRRTRVIVKPRQIAMYLSKILTPRSFPEIGRRFGGRDHTTVLHAVRKIENLIASDMKFARDIELLTDEIKGFS